MSQRFAVMGNPIAHSKSPHIHTVFAQQCQIDLTYEVQLSTLERFNDDAQAFFDAGGCGLNITVPFKEMAYALCQQHSERAIAACAVNTIWMREGRLYGDNTDGAGLVDALNYLHWPLHGANVLILGAGGATRGVLLPLLHAGVNGITIANRTLVRAQQLVLDFAPHALAGQLTAVLLDAVSGQFDIVINATSSSLLGEPLNLSADLQFQYAYEMAYAKSSSFLLRAAHLHAQTADGWSMLVCQAAEAFYQWHGLRPSVGELLAIGPK